MTKGSQAIKVRLPDDLRQAIEDDISDGRKKGGMAAVTLSEWIRGAITSKLAHSARSRKKKVPPQRVLMTPGQPLILATRDRSERDL